MEDVSARESSGWAHETFLAKSTLQRALEGLWAFFSCPTLRVGCFGYDLERGRTGAWVC